MRRPEALRAFLEAVLLRWEASTPAASRAMEYLRAASGSGVVMDHLAFRTLDVAGGMAPVIEALEGLGYERSGEALSFPKKHVAATWLRPPPKDDGGYFPRVFVSELECNKLPAEAADALRRITAGVAAPTPVEAMACLALGARPWPAPSKADYNAVLEVSDYGAWTAAHGMLLNHGAVAVHRLSDGFCDAHALADALASHGVSLSTAGGVVKESPDGLLLQVASQADNVGVTFKGGEEASVPGAYVEFAERRPLPGVALPRVEWDEFRDVRDGFETASADSIFEATDATKAL